LPIGIKNTAIQKPNKSRFIAALLSTVDEWKILEEKHNQLPLGETTEY